MSAPGRAAYDAVIIGAGHNGMVAAAYLARAGWKTIVLERNERPGGAVMSAEVTRPGFVHDLYATNLNLFLGSPVHAELGPELERHGLSYASSDRPFANVFPHGRALRVYQDAERTLAGLREHDPRDAGGWAGLQSDYARLSPTLFALYGAPIPSAALARAAWDGARRLGAAGTLELARLLVTSTGAFAEKHLATREAHALLTCWGMHLDFAPDVPGGALFPFLEAFTDMQVGMSVARGGASRLIDALAGVLRGNGGELRCGAEVDRVVLAEGRARVVVLADGERIEARRAVIANLTPSILFGRLLADAPLKSALRRGTAGYRYGPGTLMVHLALEGPVPWAAGGDLGDFAYVHVAPYSEDLTRTYHQARGGLLPAEPLLVVGQTSVVDSSRAPAGRHVLWVQVRTVPGVIAGDAQGKIAARDWSAAAEPFADRVMAKLEVYAPGVGALVLDRTVLSPVDLERHNPNLVGGDSLAGSMHLRQNFAFRPFRGLGAYYGGVGNLFMVGAATWPGAGVNALSGYHVARRLTGGTHHAAARRAEQRRGLPAATPATRGAATRSAGRAPGRR